ncbi:MAG: hypothetical protein NT169_21305 [Chloroflexi bacterium]|nr:hypothetical protein [Chloroflexota bacterium]
MSNTLRADRAEILRHLALLAAPGQVVELRGLDAVTPGWNRPHTVSGYFDDPVKLAHAAAGIQARGIYVTLNLVQPDLLARAVNRLRDCGRSDPTTADSDITERRWLLIDLDAVRPSGISATDAEHALALARAAQIRTWLTEQGWPEPIYADSGNGAHLLYRVSLPAADGGLVQNVLRALAFRFDDALAIVDQTCHNPARISKIFGTPVCKGDPTAERPHRLAHIVEAPAEVAPVSQELLAAVAAMQPPAQPRPGSNGRSGEHLDVANWLAEHNLAVSEPKAWQGGQRWVFEVCPWNSAHTDRSAYIVQFANGAIAAGCHHNSCQGRDWRDLRELVEGPRPAYRGQHVAATSTQEPACRASTVAPHNNGAPALTPRQEAEAALGVEVRDADEGEPDWPNLAFVELPGDAADTDQADAERVEEVLADIDAATDRDAVEDLLPMLTQRCLGLDRNAMLRVDRRLRKRRVPQETLRAWHGALNEQRRATRASRKPGLASATDDGTKPPATDDLPSIWAADRPLQAITADALAALHARNEPPTVFVRSGALVRVRNDENSRPQIERITGDALRGRMARTAFWRVPDRHGEPRYIAPPDAVVRDLLTIGSWPFPRLEALTETPVLRPNGTILDHPGYDLETGLYYAPPAGFELPEIPARPNSDEVQSAVGLLAEAISDFPFVDQASRANTWALLLTPILRPALNGNAPLALLDKPQPGVGASLLAELAAIIGTGRPAAMMGAPKTDEEWRKQLTSLLHGSNPMIVVDNVDGILASADLARALTSSTWQDRLLGQNLTLNLPQRATWLATGNNLRLGGDMPRRCYWIRLNAQTAQPWLHRRFQHPDLIGWANTQRGRLLAALLTLARSWWADGCPPAAITPLGSFESWSRIVAGILAHAGIAGFLSNLADLYERVDDEGPQWLRFLAAWHEALGAQAVTTAELVTRLRAASQAMPSGQEQPQAAGDRQLCEALPDYFADALANPKFSGSLTRQLGRALAQRTDMVFDERGLRLEKILPPGGKATARWRVGASRGFAVNAVNDSRESGD